MERLCDEVRHYKRSVRLEIIKSLKVSVSQLNGHCGAYVLSENGLSTFHTFLSIYGVCPDCLWCGNFGDGKRVGELELRTLIAVYPALCE